MIIAVSPREVTPEMIENSVVWNLSSYIETVPSVRIMPPISRVAYFDSLNFDQELYRYLYTSDSVFYEFFGKVMMPVYDGRDVILLINHDDDIFDSIVESIFKIMQERYDYQGGVILNSAEDYEYLNRSVDVFSARGITVFDQDKERYTKIDMALNMRR